MERESQDSYRNLGGGKEEYVNSRQASVHSIGHDKWPRYLYEKKTLHKHVKAYKLNKAKS